MRRSAALSYDAGLPLRGASDSPCSPALENRPRHLLIVASRVSLRRATSSLLSPSARLRITRARNARRCSVDPAAAQPLSVLRSLSVSTMSAAFTWQRYHVRLFLQLGTRCTGPQGQGADVASDGATGVRSGLS